MKDHNDFRQQDQILIDQVLAGNIDVFAKIIQNTESLVAQIVFKMISHTEDRKDIAQEVYLKAYKNIASFRSESKLSTWIGRIAYNTCLKHLDKKKLLLLDHFDMMEGDLVHTHAVMPDSKESSLIVGKAIDQLPPILKTVITLYHNEGLSYAEIQQITGLPEGTVKSYLFRARKSLKETLLARYKKDEL